MKPKPSATTLPINLALIASAILAIVLECLPKGVKLVCSDDGILYNEWYAYFDFTPYAYAFFAPFLTAWLTVVVLILAVVALFRGGRRFRITLTALSGLAALLSLLHLCEGMRYYTVIGGLISASLIFCTLFAFLSIPKRAMPTPQE